MNEQTSLANAEEEEEEEEEEEREVFNGTFCLSSFRKAYRRV